MVNVVSVAVADDESVGRVDDKYVQELLGGHVSNLKLGKSSKAFKHWRLDYGTLILTEKSHDVRREVDMND